MWYKPPNSPIPLSKEVIYKLFSARVEVKNRTKIATLLKSTDLSRLKVTALESNKDMTDKISI